MNDLANVPDLSGHQADEPNPAEAAYRQLRRDIIEGCPSSPARSSRRTPQDQYAVGTGTLREALQLLVTDALVVAQGQRGLPCRTDLLDDFETSPAPACCSKPWRCSGPSKPATTPGRPMGGGPSIMLSKGRGKVDEDTNASRKNGAAQPGFP